MTELFLIAASAVLSVASGPVAAREPGVSAAPAEQSTTARAEQSNQRYCVIDTVTGSRISHKKCQTRSEWLKEGFDPLNPDK